MHRLIATILVIGATAPAATGAYAQYVGPSENPVGTVRDLIAHGMDDQRVSMQGRIARHVREDKYLFVDHTGEILVEIDDDRFPPGRPVTEKTVVRLSGEFEKRVFNPDTIEVDQLEIIEK